MRGRQFVSSSPNVSTYKPRGRGCPVAGQREVGSHFTCKSNWVDLSKKNSQEGKELQVLAALVHSISIYLMYLF